MVGRDDILRHNSCVRSRSDYWLFLVWWIVVVETSEFWFERVPVGSGVGRGLSVPHGVLGITAIVGIPTPTEIHRNPQKSMGTSKTWPRLPEKCPSAANARQLTAWILSGEKSSFITRHISFFASYAYTLPAVAIFSHNLVIAGSLAGYSFAPSLPLPSCLMVALHKIKP